MLWPAPSPPPTAASSPRADLSPRYPTSSRTNPAASLSRNSTCCQMKVLTTCWRVAGECVGPIAEVPLAAVKHPFDTNVFGAYTASKAAIHALTDTL
ncbi:hypothetical protein AKJ16_DCAP11710, partial [Drosera capensis]